MDLCDRNDIQALLARHGFRFAKSLGQNFLIRGDVAEDIAAANALKPEYIGFVFAPKSKRYVSPQQAALLRAQLSPAIKAVGVFVNEPPEAVARLLNEKLIDIAQLHGQEDAAYLARLRSLTAKPLWQAFRAETAAGLAAACASSRMAQMSSTADAPRSFAS